MVSTDDIETNTRFAQENNARFAILSDPDKVTASDYGVMAKNGYASRWTFYIDPNGLIARIDKNVTPLSAGADMVRILESLGVPASAKP